MTIVLICIMFYIVTAYVALYIAAHVGFVKSGSWSLGDRKALELCSFLFWPLMLPTFIISIIYVKVRSFGVHMGARK